ncbi:NTP transferase domain-containing protein [Oxyplasma meridianum]|uniref:NTP transferase domain-containing protein n=1 Tax=Oxyplasma meridianum TaxID=3073602 RepID=A0AAX4NGA6_9ARCH
MKKISLVIFAAGLSSRFGRPKLLEEIGGKKIIEILFEKVAVIPFFKKYIVVRENDQMIKSIIPGEFIILENPHPQSGMSESVKIGIRSAFENSDGVMMIPGDQPLVTVKHLKDVINEFESSEYGIVATSCDNEIRNPAIFSIRYYKDLMEISGDSGGRGLFEKYKNDLKTVELDDCRMLEDLDYPDDLFKLKNLYNILGKGGPAHIPNTDIDNVSFVSALKLFSETPWKKINSVRVFAGKSSGLISAENVTSPIDYPSYRKSAMDGYAIDSVIFDSTEKFPIPLRIVGRVTAGKTEIKLENHDECVEIFTGGEIPAHADCVIKYEDAKRHGNIIKIGRMFKKGENIVEVGEDFRKDNLILKSGEIIRPAHISALSECMIKTVNVFKKIRISVISTGDELYGSGISGKIPDSTQPLLVNWLNKNYMVGIGRGICKDDVEEIKNRVVECSRDSDIIVITGGSGKSDHDLVRKALDKISKPVFNGVRIKPGKTITLYDMDGIPVFSISGLPVAALISLIHFINLFVEIMTGYREDNKIPGTLEAQISSNPSNTTIYIAMVEKDENGYRINPLPGKISGKISALLAGNAYIVIAEGKHIYKKGDFLEAYKGEW